nr:GAF domain-containing protein [Nocardia transvalensis]
MLLRRTAHFAAAAQFGVEQPTALRRLHAATGTLTGAAGLEDLLGRVLDSAITLTGADYGNVQLVDPATGALRIVTQSGFGPEFLDYFAVVEDATSACGRAAATGAQFVVADTRSDPAFAAHRAIAERARFRAVQSTPLLAYDGRLIGMVSTHLRDPYRAAGHDLRILRLFGDVAGELVAHRLGAADSIGWIVIEALLMPGSGRKSPHGGGAVAPNGHAARRMSNGSAGKSWPARPERTASELAGDVVGDLFTAGLGLRNAVDLLGDGHARDRIVAVAEGLDDAIRRIRAEMLCVVAGDPLP